jgi:hypothetical protein
MRLEDCYWNDENFTYIAEGQAYFWNTSAIVRWCNKTKRKTEICELREDQVSHILAHNGVNVSHVLTLSDDDLKRPVLFLVIGDAGEVILADGNHRAVYAHSRGRETIEAWILSKDEWKAFLIDMPVGVDIDAIAKALVS